MLFQNRIFLHNTESLVLSYPTIGPSVQGNRFLIWVYVSPLYIRISVVQSRCNLEIDSSAFMVWVFPVKLLCLQTSALEIHMLGSVRNSIFLHQKFCISLDETLIRDKVCLLLHLSISLNCLWNPLFCYSSLPGCVVELLLFHMLT